MLEFKPGVVQMMVGAIGSNGGSPRSKCTLLVCFSQFRSYIRQQEKNSLTTSILVNSNAKRLKSCRFKSPSLKLLITKDIL